MIASLVAPCFHYSIISSSLSELRSFLSSSMTITLHHPSHPPSQFTPSRTLTTPTQLQHPTPSHITTPIPTMEVYDLTGTREMVSMEKANEIAKVIEENASTLRNVIFRTKTYSPEVAVVIAGTLSLHPPTLSCARKGHSPRVARPLRHPLGPSLRRRAADIRGVRQWNQGPAPQVPGPQRQRAGTRRLHFVQGPDRGGLIAWLTV